MKFSLFLIYFSSLEAKHSYYTVPTDKPMMYFNGKQWKEKKTQKYFSNTERKSFSEIKDFDAFDTIDTATLLNNTLLEYNDIYQKASNREIATNDSTENFIESETAIILTQVLDLIEIRYNKTESKYPSASLSNDPEAWIQLLLSLSMALNEIAVAANESYHMFVKDAIPNFNVETWQNPSRRENGQFDELLAIFSEDTTNEESEGKIGEDIDQNNEIYLKERFPLKMNLNQKLKHLTDQDLERANNMFIDDVSADVVSDGFEEVTVL